MNRILRRPMFRIGGSTGTGITSGLDQSKGQMASADMDMKIKKLTEAFIKYKQQGGTLSFEQFSTIYAEENFNSGGRVGLQVGGRLGPGTLPGFLTGLGINLASITPRGNIFATTAEAAKDPFERFQTAQLRAGEIEGERAFQRELAEEERDFLRGETTRKLESAERIAGMNVADTTKRVQDLADTKYEGDVIKAQREVDFPTEVYPNLVDQYGNKQVATTVIDSTNLQKQKDIDKFVDLNPFLATKFVYDVATNKTMTFVKDKLSGRFKLIPADSADIDTTGDDMPDPNITPGLFGQKTKPPKELKEILPDFRETGFDEDFYQ